MKKNFRGIKTRSRFNDSTDAYLEGEEHGYIEGFNDAVFEAKKTYISNINERLKVIKKWNYCMLIVAAILAIFFIVFKSNVAAFLAPLLLMAIVHLVTQKEELEAFIKMIETTKIKKNR